MAVIARSLFSAGLFYFLTCYLWPGLAENAKGHVDESTPPGLPKLTCNFASDYCDWINTASREDPRLGWQLARGPLSSNTGPVVDGDPYVVLDTLEADRSFKATLSSPVIRDSSDNTCLSFWYFMHGYDVGRLTVWKRTGAYHKEKLFSVYGPQGKRWYQATFPIGAGTNVTLEFEGSYEGWKNLGNIALNNIIFEINDHCVMNDQHQPQFDCDFADDFCSWYAVGDFRHRYGGVGLPDRQAYYWGLRFPYHRRAYLRSKTISILNKEACLSFNYFFNSNFAESISLILYNYGEELTNDGREIWREEKVDYYKRPASVKIPRGENVYVAFRVVPKVTRNGAFMVDNIKLSYTCHSGTRHLDCDFETETCDWFQRAVPQVGQWTRHAGPTPTPDTGPDADHTTGADGFYLYLNATRYDRVRLYSPTVYNFGGACLTFWYHTYGEDINELLVWSFNHLAFLESERRQHLFKVSGNQGNQWHQGTVNIPPGDDEISVVLEASRGYFPKGDIAIDDVRLSLNGPCYEEKSSSSPPATTAVQPSTKDSTSPTIPPPTTTTVELPVKPVVVVVTGDVTPALTGSTVSLGCGPSGFDFDGKVEWTFNKPSNRFGSLVYQKRIVFLEEITPADANIYRCTFYHNNGVNLTSEPLEIIVEKDNRPRPELTSDDVLDPAVPGSDISLQCGPEVAGADYHWTFTDGDSLLHLPDHGRMLRLDHVTMAHGGRYRCCASKDGVHTALSNALTVRVVKGKACLTATECQGDEYSGTCLGNRCVCRSGDLLVDTRCLERAPSPRISIFPDYPEFGLGDIFYVLCESDAPLAKIATYRFWRDGQILSQEYTSDRFYTYTIVHATLQDRGNYSCGISYGHESFQRSVGSVQVNVTDYLDLSCDFHYDTCVWRHGHNKTTFHLSAEFAPSGSSKHFLEVVDGLSVSTSSLHGASLQSPVIGHTSHKACLAFQYRMSDVDSMSLSVWIYQQSPAGLEDQLIKGTITWEAVGYQGDEWHRQSIEIPPGNNFFILFQGQGRVAIADFKYSIHGIC